jgi:probable addiction module antidote protein
MGGRSKEEAMSIELLNYDSADHFKDLESQAELIRDAIAEGDPHYLAHALGIVARARGMTEVSAKTGINRKQLYRSLSKDGNPTMATVLKVVRALDLQMKIEQVPA